MLDDLKYIHQKDAQDALGVAQKQWQQLQHVYDVTIKLKDVHNVVVAGMGGSALAASFLNSWPTLSVPFEVVRGYDVPQHVGQETLFIASSYSGNTEETLSALSAAEQKGAQIVVIAAGGKLADIAAQKNYPHYLLPGNFQPRMAVFYNLAALVQLLSVTGLSAKNAVDELHGAAQWLSEQTASLLPDVATSGNRAKQIALDAIGKSPVIYAGPLLTPAAYKWKINFNENAKNVAWAGYYPEFNHNEFLGWSSHPIDKPYTVIDLRSNFDHPQVAKRFEVTARLLSGKRPAPITIEAEGDTPLKQLLWTVVLGDFVSLYTALLNGLNPTPVDLIEKLKQALAE